MERTKNMTMRYALSQMTYWLAFASIGAFCSYFLLNIGLSNSMIGIVLAAGGGAAAVIQPLAGAAVDRNPKLSSQRVMLVLNAVAALMGLLILIIPGIPSAVSALLFIIAYTMIEASQPFINAVGMEIENAGYPLQYGVARGTGSCGYALGAYVIGILTARFGTVTVPVCMLLLFGVSDLVLLLLPRDICDGSARRMAAEAAAKEEQDEGHTEAADPVGFIRKYPRYCMVLVGISLLFFGHCLENNFLSQIMALKGGGSAEMGTSAALAAGSEVITMLLFPLYRKKLTLSTLMKISGIFFTLKCLFSWFAPNVTVYYLVSAMQVFAWGIMAIALVYYVNEVVDSEDSAQGQAFAGMPITVGNVIGSLLLGTMIDRLGMGMTFYISTAISAAGTFIIWRFVKKTV